MAVKWQTLSGNLGTIANGNVVSDTLIATSNQSFEVTYSNTVTEIISPNIYYTILAGTLPTDLTLANDSVNNQAIISGTTSKANTTGYKSFTIRATEYIAEPNTTINDSNITLTSADRSFSYWWIGPTAPITSNTTLTNVNIGSYYEYQLTVDNDATDVNWSILDSTLHPNLSLYANGLISGYVSPTNSTSFSYNIQASNNIGSSSATYEIPVTTPNISAVYNPFITSEESVIASQRRETSMYKVINGYDYNGDTITFERSGLLPAGLTGSNVSNSYIITGTIANVGLGTTDYNFSLTPIKSNGGEFRGNTKNFTITVLGKIEDTPIWFTDSNLGTIDNSVISQLYVQVGSQSGLEFSYRLADDSGSLPNGLELKSDGTIVGKIEADVPDNEIYRFLCVVEAGSSREISSKEFILQPKARRGKPFRNLYLRMMPRLIKRKDYYDIINNSDIIPYDSLYRPLDPWFGINKLRRILFAAGLKAETFSQFIDAMVTNHWWKNLRLGEIKTAKATTENLEEVYEIVYAEIIDDAKVGDNLPDDTVVVNGRTIYSNNLERMSRQIVDEIEYEDRGIIPLWMRTRQPDGKVPGFKIVFPIAYTKPGKSEEIADRLRARISTLNQIEFVIDRYEFDGNATNTPLPLVLSSRGNIDIVSNIIGQTSATLSSTDYEFLNSDREEITLFDGMKLKFTNSANDQYRLNTYVVTGVGNSINLVLANNQTITTNSNINGNFIIGTNTFFATNINTTFATYQIHVDDWITTGNGNLVVGKVQEVISNTVLKLNANFTITNVANTTFTHTNWIPRGVPVEGDKYLIFPNVKVYNVNE